MIPPQPLTSSVAPISSRATVAGSRAKNWEKAGLISLRAISNVIDTFDACEPRLSIAKAFRLSAKSEVVLNFGAGTVGAAEDVSEPRIGICDCRVLCAGAGGSAGRRLAEFFSGQQHGMDRSGAGVPAAGERSWSDGDRSRACAQAGRAAGVPRRRFEQSDF